MEDNKELEVNTTGDAKLEEQNTEASTNEETTETSTEAVTKEVESDVSAEVVEGTTEIVPEPTETVEETAKETTTEETIETIEAAETIEETATKPTVETTTKEETTESTTEPEAKEEETTEDTSVVTDLSASWVSSTPDITAEASEKSQEVDSVEGEYNGNQNLEELKSYFRPINYVKTSSSSIDDEVETVRKGFSAKWSRNKVFNIVSVVIMLLCFIAVLLVAFLIEDESLAWVTWTVIGIAIVLIIVCFILNSVLSKKTNRYAEKYLDQYEDTINGYTLSDLNLEDATICTQGQLDDQLVIQSHCFTNISSISSRGIVLAKRNGYEYSSGEVAVIVPTISIEDANKFPIEYVDLEDNHIIPDENEPTIDTSTQELDTTGITMIDVELADEAQGKKKRRSSQNSQPTGTNTGLYGRFYSYESKVSHKESFIIAITGSKAHTYIPDYLTGFTPVKVPGLKHNIIVFAADITKSAKFFDEEGVKLLNNIPVNTVVYSHFLSVNSYGMKAGMNLSDDIMELPLNRIEHLGSYDLLKSATEAVFAYFDYVDSKKA